MELIGILKEKLEKELKTLEKKAPKDAKVSYRRDTEIRKLKGLIQECDDWTEDECEFIEE